MRSARAFVTAALCAGALTAHISSQSPAPEPAWQAFLSAASSDERTARAALDEIGARWRPGYAAMLVDMARLLPSARAPQGPTEAIPLADDTGLGLGASARHRRRRSHMAEGRPTSYSA